MCGHNNTVQDGAEDSPGGKVLGCTEDGPTRKVPGGVGDGPEGKVEGSSGGKTWWKCPGWR